MYTDSWALVPADEAVRLHLKYSKQPVYYFLFGHRGSLSFSTVGGDPTHNYGKNAWNLKKKIIRNSFLHLTGVGHCDDLLYFFPFISFFPERKMDLDDVVIQTMSKMWTDFARTR